MLLYRLCCASNAKKNHEMYVYGIAVLMVQGGSAAGTRVASIHIVCEMDCSVFGHGVAASPHLTTL